MALELTGYRFTGRIDSGAGSEIHTAVDLKTKRVVAIKHVVRQSPDDDRFLAQVEAEYEVSSKLSHDSLRKSYALHRIRKLLQVREMLLVMEYVEGLNLEKARPNRLDTFLTVFLRVAAGLHTMHEAGYVHTDIKPTNIMVTRGARVKIIDFGQACRIHHRKERIQGTPDYIAPEQVRRLLLDQRTDVFNLGATMYWVLTSEKYPTAIRGLDATVGVNVVRSDKPVAPIEHNAKIPVSLSQLIMECCRENPAERPADMRQVSGRLTAVQKLWKKYRESLRPKGESPSPTETVQSGGVIEEPE